MTEIPEHLLKRSQARRAAASGDASSASTETTPATTGASTPAPAAASGPVTRAAAPAESAAPKPKPDSAVVKAYKERKRIPGWAMLGLVFLPVWAFMYAQAVTTQVVEATGPLGVGDEAYPANCASCHGAAGQGGAGFKFSDGEVLKTFPHIEDQIRYVYYGTEKYNAAGVKIPGDPNREGGAHVTGSLGPMPGWGGGGGLSDVEILGAVCHERFNLSGEDPEENADEFELWCSEESPIFAALEAGSTLPTVHNDVETEIPMIPIGDAPAEGSPA